MPRAGIGASAAPTDDVYKLGPDSEPPAGRAPGQNRRAAHAGEQDVYPNTTRNYWVYVPAQYDAAKPACLMVFQDGHAFVNPKGDYRIPFVFDNLIYRREMPVTIGVFINPGHGPEQQGGDRRRVGRPDQQPPASSTTRWTTSTPS